MPYTLGPYQNPDIKQQTIDLLNNFSASMSGGVGNFKINIDHLNMATKTYSNVYSVSILNTSETETLEIDGKGILPGDPAVTFTSMNGSPLIPFVIICEGPCLVTYLTKI